MALATICLLALLAACGTPGQGDYDRGALLREEGDIPGALDAFSDAIDTNDKFAVAYNDRGELYRQMEEFDLALDDFNHAIEFDDELEFAFTNRGEARVLLGDYDGAIADATRAIDLGPAGTRCPLIIHGAPTRATCSGTELAGSHTIRGLAYLNLGEISSALVDLDRAILLDLDYAAAYMARARLHMATDNFSLALADVDKAILSFSQEASTTCSRLVVRFSCTNQLDPQFVTAYRVRSAIYEHLGETDEARKDLERADMLEFTAGDS